MPTLMTIEGTTEQGILLRDAMCANWFYQEFLDEPENTQPNPESKAQFARRMIRQMLKEQVIKYRKNEARSALSDAVTQATTETEGIDVA